MANIQVRGRASFVHNNTLSVSDEDRLGECSTSTNIIESLSCGCLVFSAIINYELAITICYTVVLLHVMILISTSGISADYI